MEILPFSQNVNSFSTSSGQGTKTSSLSFRNLLSRESVAKQLDETNRLNNSSSEKISIEGIINDLNNIVDQLQKETISIECMGEMNINSFLDESGEISATLYAISIEIAEVLSEKLSINELIGELKNEPTIVNILSLVKVIEGSGDSKQSDINSVLTDINKYLENEFPSYKNDQSISLESMLNSFAKMNSKDQTQLEGQMLISRLINKGTENVEIIDKLLKISSALKVLKNESIQSNLQVKNDIIAELSSVSSLTKHYELIKSLLDKADFQTIKSIFVNSVDRFLQKDAKNNLGLLNNFEQNVNFMSVDSKKQLQVENFASDIREDTFVIHLNQQNSSENESQGFTKTDISSRHEFTNQLLNAFKNSKFGQMPNGANRLILKLNPEHLGLITVRLIQKNGGVMVARLITSSQSAKDLLDHSIQQLKQVLPSVQIEIERYEVQTEQPQKTLRDHSENRGDNSNEHQQQQPDEEDNSEQTFMNSLKEALNTTV
ncbi:flagellar hook-length control protein FliK [Metabacillus halosaccharovorans]|uniref:Flagellar hook-length control protein FliK n=1 Tax=Metabacillus halosaccharovorans TaxID=930124 RepID=A0ABT3DKT0_9BACI|nr:flagellar hook-length control protein FliK [Metabacillus halosaccharovorans]MCV9887662.1 flagellar hook-length control protein FliK [Metabacillus halosaccharovorans]